MARLTRTLCVVSALLSAASLAAAQQDRFPSMSLDADPVAPAAAEPADGKLPWRTFEANLGVAFSTVSSTVMMTRGGGGTGVAVDAEGVLGMSHEVLSPQVWLAYRMGDIHRIQFSFGDLTRTATRTMTQDVEFNGNTYTIGTTLHSVYGIQLYTLSYVWSFLQDDRMDIGLTAGFDAIRLHMGVSAENPPRDENERFIIPIPLPGFTADFALTPNVWLRQRLQLMYVPINNYEGLLVDYKVALEWSMFSHVGLGIGLDILRVDLRKHSGSEGLGDFEGEVNLSGTGALLYLNLHW
jgi:hypothetical protein